MTCVDLSPFYLEKARENDDYWRRHQARGQFGGGAVTEMPKAAQFVQAAAPGDGACLPLAHASHVLSAAAPVAAELVPEGHAVHVDGAVAASATE